MQSNGGDTLKVNYAQAVKNSKPCENMINVIRSQAQTELGRYLDISEESVLFKRFPPNLMYEHIQKVC